MSGLVRSRLVVACSLAAACGSSHGRSVDAMAYEGDAPTDSPDLGTGVYAIPLTTPSGADQGSYYMPLLTASGKSFRLDLDTGSTVTGIAGATCSACSGLTPLYSPGASATDTHMTDMASYADNTGWSGEIYADSVSLQRGVPAVSLDFVDITSQTTNPPFFSGNDYQGIFGLGPAALLDPGTSAFFDALVAGGVTATMAFELCPTEGTMWLGGYDPAHVTSAPQFTPILSTGANAGFYSVDMSALSFGSTDLGATSTTLAGPIVDTGTSLFYIPSAAQTALVSAINANAAFKTLFPGQTLLDPTTSGLPDAGCAMAAPGTTPAMVDAMMPPLGMTFAAVGGGTFTIHVPAMVSYFYDAGGGQYCLDIYGGGDQGNATMGDTIMRALVTVIDVGHQQVGFALTSHCAAPASIVPHGPPRERGRGPHHVRRS
jgi:hypothetical protein